MKIPWPSSVRGWEEAAGWPRARPAAALLWGPREPHVQDPMDTGWLHISFELKGTAMCLETQLFHFGVLKIPLGNAPTLVVEL